MLGKVDDVGGLLRSVDLFVLCSKSEGGPNAVLEAMEAGLPVSADQICLPLLVSYSFS